MKTLNVFDYLSQNAQYILESHFESSDINKKALIVRFENYPKGVPTIFVSNNCKFLLTINIQTLCKLATHLLDAILNDEVNLSGILSKGGLNKNGKGTNMGSAGVVATTATVYKKFLVLIFYKFFLY